MMYAPYVLSVSLNAFFSYYSTQGLSMLELLLYEFFSKHEILTSVATVGIEIWIFLILANTQTALFSFHD
jgi:hypothetical protein